MKFNWILKEGKDEQLKRFCVDLEYRLRPKITRFLLARVDNECNGDFSCFYFDVNMISKRITLSEKTPAKYLQLIKSDLESEINHDCY